MKRKITNEVAMLHTYLNYLKEDALKQIIHTLFFDHEGKVILRAQMIDFDRMNTFRG